MLRPSAPGTALSDIRQLSRWVGLLDAGAQRWGVLAHGDGLEVARGGYGGAVCDGGDC